VTIADDIDNVRSMPADQNPLPAPPKPYRVLREGESLAVVNGSSVWSKKPATAGL